MPGRRTEPIARRCTRPSPGADPEELDLQAAYDRFPDLSGHVQDHPEAERVRVYRSSLAAETINWSPESDENLVVVVDGDLWCDGALTLFADQDEDSALILLVRGDLSARDVAVRFDAQLKVQGDLEAERLVLCGGGNLGNLTVDQTLRAGLVLEWTDGQIRAGSGDVPFWAEQKQNLHIPGAEAIDPKKVLSAVFLDKAGDPDLMKLTAAARSGADPFA